MKTKGKSRGRFSSFLAVICIIIYLFALTQAVIRFYFSINEQRNISDQEFASIAGIAFSNGLQGFMDNRFIDAINNALATSSSIEAVIITGPEGEYGFEKQKGRAINWVNGSPRFINRVSFSKESYYKTLPIYDLRNTEIRAVAEIFDFKEISKILTETIYLILIGFTIAFFTMLISLLVGKKSDETVTISSPPITPAPQRFSAPQVSKQEKETIILAPPETETGPKGLYSTRSGIGWEEYTNDRLDSELHRCSSAEKDLTLLIIEFTEITNDSFYRQAAEETATFFSIRDLLFEYGNRGIVVILPGIDLYTGISKSEKFHQRIISKFDLCIGLSSRAGRLLNADRLMFEAAEALEKAKYDPKSPIVAFKTNAEKYRDFIRNQE